MSKITSFSSEKHLGKFIGNVEFTEPKIMTINGFPLEECKKYGSDETEMKRCATFLETGSDRVMKLTNSHFDQLTSIFGDDPTEAIGKQVVISRVPVNVGGEMKHTAQISPCVQAQAAADIEMEFAE